LLIVLRVNDEIVVENVSGFIEHKVKRNWLRGKVSIHEASNASEILHLLISIYLLK